MPTPVIIGAVFVAIAIIFIVIALGFAQARRFIAVAPGRIQHARDAGHSGRDRTVDAVPGARPGADGSARVRLCRALYAGQDAGINAPQAGSGRQSQQLVSVRVFWHSRDCLRRLGGLIFFVLSLANVEFFPNRVCFTLLFAVLGFMLPALWLGSKIQQTAKTR